MMRKKGKIKQSEIAKFYGVSQGDVSQAFRLSRLEPMHWDLENAWECLYELYMQHHDHAIEKANAWKEKAMDIELKWNLSKDGIARGAEPSCAGCEYFNWDKRDKPCCHCIDNSGFVPCDDD